MPRKPKMTWNPKRGGWIVRTRAGYAKLGRNKEDKEQAQERFHELMAQRDGFSVSKKYTMLQLLEYWEVSQTKSESADHQRKVRDRCVQFDKYMHGRAVDTFVGEDLDSFIRKSGCKTSNSRGTVSSAIQSVIRFAVRKKKLKFNPLHNCEEYRRLSRGARAMIEDVEYNELVLASNDAMKDLIIFLRNTGARPKEVVTLEGWMVRVKDRLIVLDKHKTAHLNKTRKIPLNNEALAIVMRLKEKYPTGTLFRDGEGKPWTSKQAGQAFGYMRDKLKMRKTVTLYGFRHTVATELLKVMKAYLVAIALGTSIEQLERHYGHVDTSDEEVLSGMRLIARD